MSPGRVRRVTVMRAQNAATHYTPEEPDQPACDADTAADVPAIMFGTLNPDRVTCPDCLQHMSLTMSDDLVPEYDTEPRPPMLWPEDPTGPQPDDDDEIQPLHQWRPQS